MPTLAETIAQVRHELQVAEDAGEHARVHFAVETVELELTLEVQREATADGGVRLAVVSLGGKGALTHGEMNRIKLTLMPKSTGGETYTVESEHNKRPDHGTDEKNDGE